MNKLTLLCVLLCVAVLAPAQQFRQAIFLHHSVGACFYDRSLHSNLTPPTTVVKEVAAYNARTGRGVSMAVKSYPAENNNNWVKWEAILNGNDEAMDYSRPIVILKTCYIEQQTYFTSTAAMETEKGRMRNIVRRLAARPQNFFVVWNNYPAATDGNSSRAVLSAQFSVWMKDVLAKGLDSYGAFPRNVYVFDVFRKLADPVTGVCPSQYGSGSEGPGGDHPSNAAVAIVTPAFVQETFDAAVLYEQGGVPPPPTPVVLPSGEFSVLPATLAAGGGTVALSWGNTLNTTSASIGGIGAVALTGDATIVVTASRDFSLVLTGPGGTTTITKRVTVAGAPPPPPPTGGFPAGAVVRVVLTTDCVNVRSAPNLNSTVLHCEAAGTRGTVISGPTVADGYSFYYIRYADSHTGWSAGKYLELTSAPPPPPPVTPLPSGSLTVSKIQNGQAQAWWTAKDDTVGQLAGYPRIGTLSGSLTFSILKDTTLTLTLWGRGGTTNYTAYTASGVDPVQPPAAGCDTAALVARGFALARAKFDSVFAAGVASKVCPPPDTTATAIKRALAPWLK